MMFLLFPPKWMETGSRTSTTPKGNQEPPFDLCKLVEAAGGSFVARQPVSTPIPLTRTLKKAIVHKGFSFVELLSACPTNWGMDAVEANERVGREMCEYFQLGTFKNTANL